MHEALELEMSPNLLCVGSAHTKPDQAERLRALVDSYFDFAWRSLRRLGVPSAVVDDATQQLFELVAHKIGLIDAGFERSFVFGAAVRLASQHRRAHRLEAVRHFDCDTAGLPDPMPSPDELVDHKRARDLLDRVLDTLPMELRAVLILAEGEGMTMLEISQTLAIPQGTVASRLRRARGAFQAALETIWTAKPPSSEQP